MSQADVTDEQLRGRDEVKKVLQEFHKANKHPVSAVMEYAAIVRVEVAFKEVPMLYDRDVHSAFGYICSVDDHEYTKGCGSTKKDAKSSAARNALNQISQAMFGKSLQCVQPIQPPTGPKPSVAASSVPSTAVIELLRNYIGKTKHPVSTAMEYGAMTGKSVAFREVPYPNMSTVSIFACECIISNQVYPQGIAGTKKEAKTKSAVSAMNEIAHKILGYQNGTAEPEKPLDPQERQEPPAAPTHTKESPKGVPDNLTHNVIKDISSMKISMGDLHPEKRVADPLIKTSNDHSQTNGHSVTPAPPVNGVTSQATENTAWQVVKHPVSVFQEYCQRNFIPFNFDVTDCPLEQGFRATCYVREQLVAEAFAHSKKEAKKRVAALAIEALIPESEVSHWFQKW